LSSIIEDARIRTRLWFIHGISDLPFLTRNRFEISQDESVTGETNLEIGAYSHLLQQRKIPSTIFVGIMSLTGSLKQLSLSLGVYPLARKVIRLLRPAVRKAWEEEIDMLRRTIPQGALCFDVGAHFGAKSEALLHAGARVVAFEPNSDVLPELRARCGAHPSWTLVTTALGSTPALMAMNIHGRSGESSFDATWKGGGGFVGKRTVPVSTLNEAVRAFGTPYYCKIDVEGWENEVLRGLSTPIPLVSFEFHIDKDITPRTIECLRLLSRFGAAEVNVTPAESVQFHLRDWVPIQEFIDWYPGDLAQTLPQWPVGDIYVRML
jgi:FkbM family methyltransferase